MPLYQQCKICKQEMLGILVHRAWSRMSEPARAICEDCGGNTTEYNENNPLYQKEFLTD